MKTDFSAKTNTEVKRGTYETLRDKFLENVFIVGVTVIDKFKVKYTEVDLITPVGLIAPFAAAAAPEGWLICDGSAVSRETYSRLFSVIGTTYGVGDGSTTFAVPNLNGRVPVGKDGTSDFDALGETGGAKTHTLTEAQLPSHSHYNNPGYAGAAVRWDGGSSMGYQAGSGSYGSSSAVAIDTWFKNAGSGAPHNNLQPYIALNYIVKC